MKITEIETFTVGAGWKNWLFVKVHTDKGIHGIGEGTLNGFIKTTEAGVHRAEAPRHRAGPAPDQRAVEAHAGQRVARRRPHPPHRDRGGRGRLLGHSGQEPRRADPPVARRPGARQRARLRQWLVPHRAHAGELSSRRPRPCWRRASRRSSSTRSAPRKASSRARNWTSPTTSAGRCATNCRGHAHPDRRACPLHRDRRAAGGAKSSPTSTSTGGRSRPRATGRRPCTRWRTARLSRWRPARCTTRSASSTRSRRGGGVNIFQPEPMSLGGIAPSMQVANLALRPWQLHRAAPERRAGGDGGVPATCGGGAELPDPGAFRRLQRRLDARPRDLASRRSIRRTGICRCPTRRASASTSTSMRSRRILRPARLSQRAMRRAGKSGRGCLTHQGTVLPERGGSARRCGRKKRNCRRLSRSTISKPRLVMVGDLASPPSRAEQLPHGAPAHLVAVDVHRGQRADELRGEVHVAVAGNGDPLRHGPAAAVALLHARRRPACRWRRRSHRCRRGARSG